MSIKIAIGVGCRRGCPADVIVALVRQALSHVPDDAEPLGLFTIRDKIGEVGLVEAADRLGLELIFLPRLALGEQEAAVHTPSIWSGTLFGVPSVSEAAAVAGAGAGSALIVKRLAGDGATCAIARQRA